MTPTPEIWENGHVNLKVFNNGHHYPLLTIISINSINSKRLTPVFYNKYKGKQYIHLMVLGK